MIGTDRTDHGDATDQAHHRHRSAPLTQMEPDRPADQRVFLVGTLEDLTLFTNYLAMLTDSPPFDVARVRARIRRDLESAKSSHMPIMRIGLPPGQAGPLQSWIATQTVTLAQANRRHMCAMLKRLAFFERH